MLTARTVLEADDPQQVKRDMETLRARLAIPDPQALNAWEDEQSRQLKERGKGLALHPLEVLKVSTPNRGSGWEVIPVSPLLIPIFQ